ncbi:mitochondrial sodium/calcium exchanger protein-like [Mytilus californianus]|uniref:mitochondrial sodium/calcium exchanger protein-like n=1 Tax=Mytilus californianus TaxID=6549 RepID=UPI0022483390|nr:mitochondrial sodium/calcium exchanger protein-like [Mytilus californianus]
MTVVKSKTEGSRTSSKIGCTKICIAAVMFLVFYIVSELRSSDSHTVVKLDPNHQLLQSKFSMRSLMGNNDTECREVRKTNHSEQCDFIRNTDDCALDEGFIDYLKFTYCNFNSSLRPLALIILFVWWVFLFIGLAVTADDYFCPSLTVISKTLHLSHNIAGVTFLAFGNGAPDIFSAIAAVGNAKNGDAGLAFGALLGAGVFVTTVVAGTIAIICPFDAMQRPFLRDVIFYLGATFLTFTVLWQKEIGKIEAIGYILLYVLYVLIVVIGRYFYQKKKKTTVLAEITVSPEDTENLDESYPNSVEISREDLGEGKPLLPPREDQKREPGTPFEEFLSAINPIDVDEWSEMKWYAKGYEVFKSPLVFLLIITIPVVDYREENHKWNRYLNSLQIFTGFTFGSFATKVGLETIGGSFPVWVLLMVIGLILSIVVFCTSKNDVQPVYQPALAYLGFVLAVVWIYIIANEIVNILQTFGIVFNISDAILGLTLLAWGNSIGDLIADTVMAKQGFPRMGMSACFGGPLFNLLLGIGIPFTIGTIKNGGTYKIKITVEEVVLVSFLMISLLTSLVVVPLSKFRMSKPYGILLIVVYIVFLIVAILAETGTITGDINP